MLRQYDELVIISSGKEKETSDIRNYAYAMLLRPCVHFESVATVSTSSVFLFLQVLI